MLKASIELFKIHKSFKVKFGLILKEDEYQNKTNLQLISKFTFNGNEYVRINPYPFITIDIMGRLEKNEEWNTNFSVTMNRKDLFLLILSLKKIHKKFSDDKDLFYYDDKNELVVDVKRANNAKEIVNVGSKTLWFQPCIVTNEENKSVYEGLFMVINSPDYFTYLTYFELGYLIHELTHLDMGSLSMSLITLCNGMNLLDKVENKEYNKLIVEQIEEPGKENTPILTKPKQQESSIPEI